MMDGAAYAQELLYNIQYDLCNIQILQPGEFVQQLLCFPLVGLEQRVVGLVRQVIHHFQNQRAILKYIYIIDKLMKVPSFIPAIQNSIVDIYSELFLFLLQQKCSTEIEQLKILRKYWVGKLHPFCLKQIKDILLQRTGIDIDCGFKSETINRIRQYYSTKLNMSAEEMALHLPSMKKNQQRFTSSSINNQRYMVQATSLYDNYSHTNPLTPSFPAYSHYPPYSQSFPMAAQVNFASFPVKPSAQQSRRKRLASQQTRAAIIPANVQGVQCAPRKMVHRNEVIIDYKYMLSKLKTMNPFACRECGLAFMTTETHDHHRADHFKEKLTKNDRNARQVKIGKLCSVQDWLAKSDLDFSLDQFYISIPKQELQQRLCQFCCAPLDIDFRNNQWVYTNAALVSINGLPATLHKSCHLALQAENEQE